MNAEQYLNEALGGNMNISTLKLLAWHEIMEGYARHKLVVEKFSSPNTSMLYADAHAAYTKVSSIMASDYLDSVSNNKMLTWKDGFESGFYAARQHT